MRDAILTEVTIRTQGTALAADAAAAATTINVDDVSDFNEDTVGQLGIGGTTLRYATADPETQVITLLDPLEAAYTAGEPVSALTATQKTGQVWEAWILIDGSDLPVPATIPSDWITFFREGDEQAGLVIGVVQDDDGTYVVMSTPGAPPDQSGIWTDPATVPDRVATARPTEVLTLTVVGDDTYLTAVAKGDPIDATTMLQWRIDGVLVATNRTPVFRFTVDSTGAALAAGQVYNITVQPTNVVGSGTLSPAVPGSLNPAVSSTTILAAVSAGFVLAGAIQVGTAITINSNPGPDSGIKINLSNGGLIHFPADGSDAIITAILRARSLVSENNLRILGTTNTLEGTVTLVKGVTAPTTAPRLTNSWTHAAASTTLADPTYARDRSGLVWQGGAWWSTYDYTTAEVGVSKYDTAGARVTGAGTGIALGSSLQPFGGLTYLGSTWYVLLTDLDRGEDAWYVRRYDSSWNYLGEWQFTRSATTGTPVIGNDGTDLWIARPTGTGRIEVSKWSPTGVDQFTIVQSPTGTVTTDEILTGLYIGSADFGALRYVVSTYSAVFVMSSAGARQTAQEWSPPNGEKVAGIAWDGTRFHSLAITGKIWHHSQVVTDTARSGTHTRYSATGPYETEASPAATYTQKRREWLRVDVDPADPNRSGVYIANKLQEYLAAGVTTAVYDVPTTTGAAAPTANGFAAVSAPGSLVSSATDVVGALISLLGTGSGRVGPLSWDAAGKVLKSPTKAGKATITTGAAGSVTSVTVTFAVPFAVGVVPLVTATVVTSRPDLNAAGVGTATNTGFTLYLYRNAAAATLDVNWQASVPE